jgi:hypothetical protein
MPPSKKERISLNVYLHQMPKLPILPRTNILLISEKTGNCKGKKRKEMEDERNVIGNDMKIAHITR